MSDDHLDCDHRRPISGSVTSEFLGEKFEIDGIVCADCGAQLWDAKASKALEIWKRKLCERRDIRDRMQIHNVSVSYEARSYLEVLKSNFFILSDSKAINAVLSAYFSLRHDVVLDDQLSTLSASDRQHTFKIVRLSPYNFMQLDVQASLFDMEMSTVAEEIVNRVIRLILLEPEKFSRLHRNIELAASV